MRAGGLLVAAQGRVGFWPIARWYGAKPYRYVRKFLPLIAHATAISILLIYSSKILLSIPPKIKFCLLRKSLLQGDSVLFNLKCSFIDLHMLVKWSLANSLPLSLRNFLSKPYTLIHNWNILLMMIRGFLDVIMADAERGVAWSIICSNVCFL